MPHNMHVADALSSLVTKLKETDGEHNATPEKSPPSSTSVSGISYKL